MRRVLERLWVAAQARVVALPDAPRLLARARAALGMAAGDFLGPEEDEEVEVSGVGQGRVLGSVSGGSKEHEAASPEKGDSRARAGAVEKDGDGTADERVRQSVERGAADQARFLETFVFLEEFLKELFCALQAKSHVQKDAKGLCESHRQGSLNAHRGMAGAGFMDDAENSSLSPRRYHTSPEKESQVADDGVAELPTSLDEFLRTEALPVFVSAPPL